MPYKIIYKSCTQWQGTECEDGDTDETYETLAEAQAKKEELESNDKHQLSMFQHAAESQGLECWMEIQEVEQS